MNKRCRQALLLLALTGLEISAVVAAPASFFADRRAREVGDVLTIVIAESASVSQTARTRADKSQQVGGALNRGAGDSQRWNAEVASDYVGGGRIERSGRLVGTLAVRVTGIDAAGNLLVEGHQEIAINNEHQRLEMSGVVRPVDIGPDNTVLSWRVTGAQISLTGRGFLSRKQSPGWLGQLLSFFGL